MIHVHDLNFTYRNGTHAVKDATFNIAKGEIFGFLGPSGAGKSTTQNILIRLLTGYNGDVRVFDKPLNQWDEDYYQRVGVGFELPNSYQKLSGLENLRFFRSLYAGETVEPQTLLDMVGLDEAGNMLVSQYSKGMQMRLNFARALLNRPELLFLDEPTTGLDPGNAVRIKDIIREQKRQGRTIFLTTHNMSVADELCDRVAFIVDGQIAKIDSPRNLKLTYGEPVVRVEYGHEAARFSAEFPLDNLGDNDDFHTLLRNQPIQTIHTKEASLEEIFLQVTGRTLV